MTHKPLTLGDKLTPVLASANEVRPPSKLSAAVRNSAFYLLNLVLLAAIITLPVWWFTMRPDIDENLVLVLLAALLIFWFIVYHRSKTNTRTARPPRPRIHDLLANDRQGFMRDLRLDAKTAVFDGSNIYHFGRSNGLDAQPLGELAHQLRAKGYRIVSFFDANIFYTLNEDGAFPREQAHSTKLLEDIFGLSANEIYVVPSGNQADKYILESLKHLPISFAVTNDLYRDYAKSYPSVMKDSQWRKGVVVSKNGVRLR